MSSQTRSPSRLRLAGFVFVGVYPLVTAMLYLLVPATPDWPIWQRNLLMVPVIVAAMVWVIIPRIHRHFSRWL
ncbi:MAG: hypothetical protein R3D85_00665 [Paracoccaceae bacterium]